MTNPCEKIPSEPNPKTGEHGDQPINYELDPSSLRITAIFSHHTTPQDAQNVADQIRPGSLVFTEGMTLIAQTETDDRINEAFSRPDYSYPLAEHLSEKGCQVFPADYNAKIHGTDLINHEMILRSFVHPFTKLESAPLESSPEPTTFRTTFSDTIDQIDIHYSVQLMRDEIAVQEVLAGTEAVLADEENRHLVLDEDGQPHVYILYGSAHQDSLAEAFLEEGIEIEKVILGDTAEHVLIPTSLAEHARDRRRNIAHGALAHLISCLEETTSEDKKRMIEDLYGRLDYLNNDRGTTLALLSEARKIKRALIDPEQAEAGRERLMFNLSGIGVKMPGVDEPPKALPSRYVYHDEQVLIQIPHK